jgi:hypothetical protein
MPEEPEGAPLCRPAAKAPEFLPIATNAAKIVTTTAQTTASRRTQLSSEISMIDAFGFTCRRSGCASQSANHNSARRLVTST